MLHKSFDELVSTPTLTYRQKAKVQVLATLLSEAVTELPGCSRYEVALFDRSPEILGDGPVKAAKASDDCLLARGGN